MGHVIRDCIAFTLSEVLVYTDVPSFIPWSEYKTVEEAHIAFSKAVNYDPDCQTRSIRLRFDSFVEELNAYREEVRLNWRTPAKGELHGISRDRGPLKQPVLGPGEVGAADRIRRLCRSSIIS
jgi:hypothetical protein